MPRPVTVTFSGTIGAPIEKVFALLTDPARLPDWLPHCQAVKAGNPERGKGEHWRLLFHNGLRKIDVEIEIIDYSPPYTFGWVEHRRRAGTKHFFKLQFSGGATRITMKHSWTAPNLRAWLLGHLYRRRNAKRMFDGLLQNLRKLLTR